MKRTGCCVDSIIADCMMLCHKLAKLLWGTMQRKLLNMGDEVRWRLLIPSWVTIKYIGMYQPEAKHQAVYQPEASRSVRIRTANRRVKSEALIILHIKKWITLLILIMGAAQSRNQAAIVSESKAAQSRNQSATDSESMEICREDFRSDEGGTPEWDYVEMM